MSEMTETERAEHRARVETIEINVKRLRAGLHSWAVEMAARYNGGVYLLGSILHNHLARDVDIRIVLHDDEFAARYGMELERVEFDEHHNLRRRHPSLLGGMVVKYRGGHAMSQRWIDDVAKFSGNLSLQHKMNFDVKVWPDSHWMGDRIYPEPICLAKPSGRWFVYTSIVPDPRVAHDNP